MMWKIRIGCAVLALCVASPTNLLAQPAEDVFAERAFEGAQWVMATQAARAIAQVGARAALGDGPLAEKIRLRQTIEERLTASRKQLADLVARPGRDTKPLRQKISDLGDQLVALDKDIRTAFPQYAEFSNPRPLDYDALREELGPQEALMLFLSDRSATYVWAVTNTGAQWHRSELSSNDLETLIRRVRVNLDPTGPSRTAVSLAQPTGPRAADFDGEAAHALYNHLFAPLAETLHDANHIYVVKDGALSSLPLSVLLQSPPVEDMDADDLRNADWLIRSFAFTTLPAVSSLPSLRTISGPPRQPRFAGFGNPQFANGVNTGGGQTVTRSIDAFFDGSETNLDAVRALSPLPGTAKELRQIARLFPDEATTVVLGSDATERAVKQTDLTDVSILSFATHGLITGDISGLAEPALAFSPPSRASALDDGLLTASEASELQLNAEWVILSACNTAAGDGTPGAEGLSGLARAFLFAGARSILVSHWPVRDDVTAELTAETLHLLNENPTLARSEALRQAILGVMEDENDPTRSHPSAWAPFVLVGAGGAD